MNHSRPLAAIFVLASILAGASSIPAQQTIVLPAVADGVAGLNGSYWFTELQIIKINPSDIITVRRLWVCLEHGGFAEAPDNALTWEMEETDQRRRMMIARGDDLLQGTNATLGAVALTIEGGPIIATARIANLGLGTIVVGSLYGQGQQLALENGPLIGPAHLPWVGGDSREYEDDWQYYRNNIGIANPNPTPLTVTGTVIPFLGGAELSPDSGIPETIEVALPPYGWRQIAWKSTATYTFSPWGYIDVPTAGYVIGLQPDSEAPYYAYASVIFTPEPSANIPAFNDPLFIPARPGAITPSNIENDEAPQANAPPNWR